MMTISNHIRSPRRHSPLPTCKCLSTNCPMICLEHRGYWEPTIAELETERNKTMTVSEQILYACVAICKVYDPTFLNKTSIDRIDSLADQFAEIKSKSKMVKFCTWMVGRVWKRGAIKMSGDEEIYPGDIFEDRIAMSFLIERYLLPIVCGIE